MIKSTFSDTKVTANQFAKQQVLDALDARSCGLLEDSEDMTEKEKQAVSEAWERQVKRIEKLLDNTKMYSL